MLVLGMASGNRCHRIAATVNMSSMFRPPPLPFSDCFRSRCRISMKTGLMLLLSLCAVVHGQSPTIARSEWGAPEVNVSHANGRWMIEGKKQKVILVESTLALEAHAGPVTWAMVPSGSNALTIKTDGPE